MARGYDGVALLFSPAPKSVGQRRGFGDRGCEGAGQGRAYLVTPFPLKVGTLLLRCRAGDFCSGTMVAALSYGVCAATPSVWGSPCGAPGNRQLASKREVRDPRLLEACQEVVSGSCPLG